MAQEDLQLKKLNKLQLKKLNKLQIKLRNKVLLINNDLDEISAGSSIESKDNNTKQVYIAITSKDTIDFRSIINKR